MQKTVLLLFILVLPIVAFSQRDFRPGFVVLNSGDTIQGYIQYQVAAKISDECRYRSAKKGEVRVYKADDLLGYGITDEKYYTSMVVDSVKKTKSFLEKLVTGKVSVYRYQNMFYASKDKLYKLEKPINKINDQNVWYEQEYKKYAGILNYMFLDCGSMGGEAFQSELNERDLVNLAVKYNKCMGHPYVDYKQFKPHHTIEYYPMAGVSFVNLSFSSYYYPFISASRTDMDDVSPVIGFGVEFAQPRSMENISGNLELLFSNYNFYQFNISEISSRYITEDIHLDYANVRIPLSLKYKFSSGPTSASVRFGYVMNIFFNGRLNVFQSAQNIYDPSIVTERREDYEIGNLPIGQFWGAVGVQRRIGKLKAFVEFRAELIGGKGNSGVRQKGGDYVVIDAKSVNLTTLSGLVGIMF